MNKQRIGVLLFSLLGMFAVFMPWAHTIIPGMRTLNGMHRFFGHNGWYILVLFGIPFALSLIGKHSESLKKIPFYIVSSLSLLVAGLVIFEMIRFKFGGWLQGQIASLGWGLFVIVGAGILTFLCAFFLRSKIQRNKTIDTPQIENDHVE